MAIAGFELGWMMCDTSVTEIHDISTVQGRRRLVEPAPDQGVVEGSAVVAQPGCHQQFLSRLGDLHPPPAQAG